MLYLPNGTLYVKHHSAPRWDRTRVLSRLDVSRARLFANTNAQCCTHCGLARWLPGAAPRCVDAGVWGTQLDLRRTAKSLHWTAAGGSVRRRSVQRDIRGALHARDFPRAHCCTVKMRPPIAVSGKSHLGALSFRAVSPHLQIAHYTLRTQWRSQRCIHTGTALTLRSLNICAGRY